MKTSTKRLLLGAALVAAALCASPALARRAATPETRDGAHFYGLAQLFSFDGINVERRDGEVVGVSLLQRDGSWLPLKQQSTPTSAVVCTPPQSKYCWEDEKGTVVCTCTFTLHIISVAGGGELNR